MGWDPETGMWTPDEFRQPLGALGATTNYLNARRAQAIADQKSQQREATTSALTQQTEQQAGDYARDDQLREAVKALGPNATEDQILSTMTQFDPIKTLPLRRGLVAAKAKTSVADIQAGAGVFKSLTAGGMPPAQAALYVKRKYGFEPEDMEEIQRTGGAPLLVPSATAREKGARATLDLEKAEDIQETRDPRITKLKAEAQYLKARVRNGLASGAKYNAKTISDIDKAIAGFVARKQAIQNQKDFMGMPKPLTEVDNADLAEIDSLIADAKESRDIAKRMVPSALQTPGAEAPAASPEDEANKFLGGLTQ